MSLRLLLLLLPLWGGALAKDSSYWLELQEDVTAQESMCVSVPCKFYYSWGLSTYYLFWFKKEENRSHHLLVATNKPEVRLQERFQGRFSLPTDSKPNDCSLFIRDVNVRDSGTYFLLIKHAFNEHIYTDKMLSLKVTALTSTPSILLRGTLESGRPKKLTCNVPWACKQDAPPIFSWTSAAHTSLGPRTLISSQLTLTPRPQDHGTNLTCQVYFPATRVTVERTVQLGVTYAPQNMAISVFQENSTALKNLQTTSLSILEGEALRLLCVADSNPPAQLSWFQGSPALKATPMSSTAVLELPRVGPADEGELTCHAQHLLGSQSVSLRISVDYPPRLLGPSCSWEAQGLSCNCSSRALPAPSLRWRLGEGLLEGNQSSASYTITSSSAGPWTHSSLSLNSGLSSGLRLSCEAGNVHGAQSTAVLLLPEPPQLLGPSCSWEAQGLSCSCSSRALPAPSLRWRLGERLLEGNQSGASYTITSRSAGPWTNSSLSLSRGLSVGLRLSCEAQNVHGAQSSTVLGLPGKPEPRAGGVLGMVGGAGFLALALLSLCLCLIFRVKTCREKAIQLVQSIDEEVNPAVGSGSGAHQHPRWADSPSAHPAPDGAGPAPEKGQELHYAFIRFHNLKLQGQEDADTVYSEIKTHK